MEFAEKQLIIMQPEEVQTSRTWLKVTQDKRHDFPSNKCCFCCGSSTHFANKCNIVKGKTCQKCSKEGHFCGCLQIKSSEIVPVSFL